MDEDDDNWNKDDEEVMIRLRWIRSAQIKGKVQAVQRKGDDDDDFKFDEDLKEFDVMNGDDDFDDDDDF